MLRRLRLLAAKVVWVLRGKRAVRIHFLHKDESLDGILVAITQSHYVVEAPRVLESDTKTHSVGNTVWVPAERVWFFEVRR